MCFELECFEVCSCHKKGAILNKVLDPNPQNLHNESEKILTNSLHLFTEAYCIVGLPTVMRSS